MIAPLSLLSLRAKFLLTILFGAVLPLAIAGVWLTRTMVHTGEDLLRSELEASLATIASAVHDRWAVREGDLLLLARNDVAASYLAGSAPLTADDRAFLTELATQVQAAIPSFMYRDTTGAVRWQFERGAGADAVRGRSGLGLGPTLNVVLPVKANDGRRVGELDARVAVATILPEDSLSVGIAGARLSVLDGSTSVPLLTTPRTAAALTLSDSSRSMLQLVKRIEVPSLTLVIAAPRAPYVAPFERAARLGLTVLLLVALGALVVSALLAAQMSGALKRVADAADAVATGDLDRSVAWRGRDEIGRLTAAFNSMTESLKRTLNELSERRALAAVGEFAASLSHEVRNALTAVRVDLQHAERRLAGAEKERELVGRALANVHRLDRAVTGALRTARTGTVERASVDLRDVLVTAMREAEPTFAAARASLYPLEDANPAIVEGNAVALEQMFLNLLLNAGEALSGGGHARIAMCADAERVIVSVIDDGAGMSDETRSRIGNGLYSSKTTGTGLGVRIARRIAEAHGGDINFESVEGHGTTVRVTLPRSGV